MKQEIHSSNSPEELKSSAVNGKTPVGRSAVETIHDIVVCFCCSGSLYQQCQGNQSIQICMTAGLALRLHWIMTNLERWSLVLIFYGKPCAI